jgi:hypothetical protein
MKAHRVKICHLTNPLFYDIQRVCRAHEQTDIPEDDFNRRAEFGKPDFVDSREEYSCLPRFFV